MHVTPYVTLYMSHHACYIIHVTSRMLHHTCHTIHVTSYMLHHTCHTIHVTLYMSHHTSHHTYHMTLMSYFNLPKSMILLFLERFLSLLEYDCFLPRRPSMSGPIWLAVGMDKVRLMTGKAVSSVSSTENDLNLQSTSVKKIGTSNAIYQEISVSYHKDLAFFD